MPAIRDSEGRFIKKSDLLQQGDVMATTYSLQAADNSPIGDENMCAAKAGASLDAILDDPNMNWRVSKLPIYDGNGNEIKNRKVITRDDTGQHFEVVSDRYTIVQNSENIEFFRPLFDTGRFSLDCAGTYRDGSRAFLVAKRNDARPIEPVKGDEIHPFFGIRWGHDGDTPIKIQAFATRVFCSNVFPAIDREAKESEITIKHRRGVHDTLDVLSDLTARSVQKYAETESALRKLAKSPISKGKLETYFRNVLHLPYRDPDAIVKDDMVAVILANRQRMTVSHEEFDRLMDLGKRKLGWLMKAYEEEANTMPSSAQETYYHAWNAVTRHVTHDAVTCANQSRFEKAIAGLGADLSTRAYSQAIELAVA
jgi:phage/plasmid-like protein (TIGR03299 family)